MLKQILGVFLLVVLHPASVMAIGEGEKIIYTINEQSYEGYYISPGEDDPSCY